MKSAGEIISSLTAELFDGQLMKKARTYSNFFSSWASILSDNRIAAAADHSRVLEIERHVVMVEADHPGWVQILQTKQREILEDLQHRFPDFEIRGIAFRYAAMPDRTRHVAEVEPEYPRQSPAEGEEFPLAVAQPEESPKQEVPVDDTELLDSLRSLKESIIRREEMRTLPLDKTKPL